MFKKNIAFILFLFFITANAQLKALQYKKKITISDGLAHNGVSAMLEDSKGYVWFGTYDGLNRYDGYSFETFKNSIDKKVLASNRVRSLFEDAKGGIWIGTEDGITLYDAKKQQFRDLFKNKTIYNTEGPVIRNIISNNYDKNIYCLTSGKGVMVFNPDYKLVKYFYPKTENPKKRIVFFDGVQVDKTHFLFSTARGVYLLDTKSGKFEHLFKEKIKFSNSLIKVYKDQYIITSRWGLVLIDLKRNNGKLEFSYRKKVLEKKLFKTLKLDPNGNLWLGTINYGLLQVHIKDLLEGDAKPSYYFRDDINILRSSSFLFTGTSNCWFATFNQGVYQIDLNENPFKGYSNRSKFVDGRKFNPPTFMCQYDNDRVYLSSPLAGLTFLNTAKQTFEEIPSAALRKYAKRIKSFFIDKRGGYWFKLREDNNHIYRLKKDSIKPEKVSIKKVEERGLGLVRSFAEDDFGNIWIGTNTGLFKVLVDKNNNIYDLESLNHHDYFKTKSIELVREVYADPILNCIWVGSDKNGLYKIVYKVDQALVDAEIHQYKNDIKDKNSISSDFVTSVIRLPNNDLWLGTEGGGICKMILSDHDIKFIPFTEKDGLSNDVVKDILFDNDLNLWVATNIGLNKVNPKNKTCRIFSIYDGLPFEDFWFSSCVLPNGNLLFSGLNGVCSFQPNQIPKTSFIPKLNFENLKINAKQVKVLDTLNNRVLLTDNIVDTKELNLNYNENVFSIDAISLHYSRAQNFLIKYKLLPLHKDWIVVESNENTLNFSGLQPGKYELIAKASNSLNKWTSPKSIKITITPPYWKTTWAYIIYVLLLAISIYLITRIVLKIQELNHKVEIEQIESDRMKEMNEAKLRFFSNISHEIKTPLTLISGPINLLKERYRANSDISDKLNLVSRQSKKITQLIEQVQDFRRADANLLKMDYNRFNFNLFVEDLIVDFDFFAKNDQKKLIVKSQEDTIVVSADKSKLEKILNNLISNALKYTQTDDTIEVSYHSDGKDLIISVKDTGRGIDSVDLNHVFERFYQSRNKQNVHLTGSGIGLAFSKKLVEMHYGYIEVDSELNVGTTITVKLPVVKKQTESEKLEEERIKLPKEKEVLLDDSSITKDKYFDIEATGEFADSVVFYAEDNTEMRNFVESHLSKFFTIKCFRNGLECLEAMEDQWPDLVISDIQMPELNGLDLCIKIKSDLKTSHIPVILLTALTNIQDHLQGIKDGADAYIKKPFNFQELVTTVEALLSNRKKLRERFQIGIPLTKENKNSRNDNAFLDKLYSLLEENLDNQNFNLDNLAKELYLNRTHFYQKVKELTDQTPFEILKGYRLKKAAELLAQQSLPVSAVCTMTGFKDRTHFAKAFKSKYGVSPSKYAASLDL